jgi:hypothetical protein
MGLIATPESMPDPARFLRRVADAAVEAADALERQTVGENESDDAMAQEAS